MGAQGSRFVLKLRQSNANPLDFSAILAYRLPNSNQLFRLRRYNGSSHEHTNNLERERFLGFHVHMATERYQELDGFREDHFAVASSAYANLEQALARMLEECGFETPGGFYWQTQLFGEEV